MKQVSKITSVNDKVVNGQYCQQTSPINDNKSLDLTHSNMKHFKIVKSLGKDSMGEVYKAKDLALERFVAIKLISISNAKQSLMLSEAKTISKLNHPNIVKLYDIARDNIALDDEARVDDADFIVMEWVDGQPLNTIIPRQGLPINKVLEYSKQMLSAIACAHQQNIIHREIQPKNMLLDVNGNIKILNFGVARLISFEENIEQPQAEGKLDRFQYMAPEQILKQESDVRSDLFSLGVVLYEMLTGVKPFIGLNVKQITQAITNGQYIPITEHKKTEYKEVEYKKEIRQKSELLPIELVGIIEKLLHVEPVQRYQTAQALALDIEVLENKIKHQKHKWQQQLSKLLLVLFSVSIIVLSFNKIFFPPSTQELVAQQLVKSKKIAFLPLDNISGDPVLEIFSHGISTMLSSDLAEVGYQQGDGTTWVLPASEIRSLEDQSVTGVYDQYGVDVIINGSIQHMGSTRLINLNLVNGADGHIIKSVQLTVNAGNLFSAQSQIRQQVMALLDWHIPPELKLQFAAKKPSFDGAYKHYVQGQGYLYRFDYQDNIAKAIKAFQTAITLDAKYADAYVGLAQAQLRSFIEYQNIALLKQMENTVQQLMQLDSGHHLLNYLYGELMLQKGQYQAAVSLFQRNIELYPKFIKAYTSLSLAYQHLRKLADAEKILISAYQSTPNNNIILAALGGSYYNKGNYAQAIKYFNLLIKNAPNNYTAYLNVSACYYLNGEIEKALLNAKKALTIQPNFIVYSNIGTYYFILRKYDKAVKAFENMIALNDRDYINWGNLADAYRFAKNNKYVKSFEQAIIIAEKNLQINPNNKYVIALLAYYYANVGNIDKTIFYAQKITKDDLGENLFFIAAAYSRLKMNKKAHIYLAFAINNNYSIAEIIASPLLDNLKNTPQYRMLIEDSLN